MALYDTRFGLPQSMVDYLNQGLPSIQQPYRPGYDKNYGPGEGMAYTQVEPQPGYQYVYGPDGQRYSIPIPGYDPNENADIDDQAKINLEGVASLYPETGGGNDGYKGGGKFGNLDLSMSKTFTKNIYDEEEGDFVPTELTAYYNPTLGNYQTFEGKNINPMFSNTGLPTFGLGTLAAKMFGFEPKTVGGYVPGSIQGFYNTPMDFFNKKKNEQMATVQQIANQRKKDQARIDALKAMTTNAAGGGQDTGGSKTPDYSNVTTGGPPSQGGGSKSSKSSSKNSSQAGGSFNSLGFSDKRLKENIELIGKSPSNINIYKFNYKDNPTTYQGAMAHEVPWASVKHSNGYMMVDYNLIDVDFKKYNA